MAKYLIHCCQKRKWYVDNFLIPSMLKQGIERDNILVYNDAKRQGNLKSFIESAKMIDTIVGGTWHLQDDIIISSCFKRITEEYDKGIMCGFCNCYSEDLPIGIRPIRNMWYSFPCIRIPNGVLKGFIRWLQQSDVQNKYRAYIEANKFDDSLFREYVLAKYPDKFVQNICPNIVDNIDYLIGGSVANVRSCNVNSIYFNEKELIDELKDSINKSVYKQN